MGIPRGGVVVASVLAEALAGELDVILTRKLRTPGNPELAMGSVNESGRVYLNHSILDLLQISAEMIEDEKTRQMEIIRARAELYRRIHPKIPLEQRVVIVTDDGIATGSTMKAALQAARTEKPQKLVVALPVGPAEQVTKLRAEADEMVCLSAPEDFMAVGQFYEAFEQVDDEDVIKILSESSRRA